MGFVREQKMRLEFQPYMEGLPLTPSEMYGEACRADETTVTHWQKVWLDNLTANKKRFGSFKDHSVGKLFGFFRNRPCIVAGSGPSLKFNAPLLKDRGPDMGLVSCLHNFHFLEDLEANVDLYVSLDAGPIVLSEVSEGGTKSPDEYWAMTKGKKLAAFAGSDPELFEKWQGDVYLFNAPIPNVKVDEEKEKIDPFFTLVSSGGNVLGSSVYIAKVFLGANPIIFIGADMSFGYEISEKTGKHRFHSWDSKYDEGIGHAVKVTDVFGNKVPTWPSYLSFKRFFDYVATVVPGIWINATEGGILGAADQGNIRSFMQMTLKEVFEMYHISEGFREQCEKPDVICRKVCY